MPSAKETSPSRRRRGAILETALLEATWDELAEHGYGDLTLEAVAERASTSRAVLYRRWPSKPELVLAALKLASLRDPIRVPDTGSLRGDVLELLHRLNGTRAWFGITVAMQLSSYFAETGTTLSDLRAALMSGQSSAADAIMRRAADRGELDASSLGTRLVRVPFDLYRQELMLRLRPLDDATIESIVDDVFLPAIRGSRT